MADIGTPIESPTSVGLRRSFRKSGAPVDGTSGTLVGVADPGDVLIDYTNKKLYVNTNTKASPTWSQILTAGVAFAGDITMTGDLDFSGANTTHAINFDAATLSKTLIGAGSYSSPMDQSCTTGLAGFTSTSDDADSWRYSAGLYIKGTGSGTKVLGLGLQSEYNGLVGADRLFGMNSIAYLGGGGEAAKLLTLGGDGTAGMYAGWFKVTAPVAAVVDSGSRVAALWIDNQMNCVCNGEEYAAFITCGGSKVDAVFGFETTSSGWTSLFYFDETAYDQDPVVSGDATGGNKGYHLRVNLNGTMYGIQLYAL